MRRIRVIHRLRTVLALLGFLLAVGAAAVLWWANHTGLPDSWRDGVEQALAGRGMHAEVRSLRYLPLRGIEAGEVTVYTDDTRTRTLGNFRKLLIEVDQTKLSRGVFRVEQLDLSGASISLPADPEDPASKTLDLTELRGRMHFSGARRLNISDASGMIGGLRFALNGELLLYRPGAPSDTPEEDSGRAERRAALLRIIETIESFEIDPKSPPRIRAEITGDLEKPESYHANFSIHASQLRSRELEVQRMELQAEVRNQTLVIHQADIDSTDGRLNGKAEMELLSRKGKFALRSDLDLTEILTKLRLPLPDMMPTFGKPPIVDLKGKFGKTDEGWDYQLMGFVDVTDASLLHYSAERLSTSFSWDGSRLLLEDFSLSEGPRSLTGRAFITPDVVRYQASGSLTVPYVQKTLQIRSVAKVLKDFSAVETTEVQGSFEGRANPKDRQDWTFKGSFEGRDISYRGVPARFAKVDLDLTHQRLDFKDGEVEFDYSDYGLRNRHDGPETGRIKVDLIRYDRPTETVAIKSLSGSAYPAPIVRTFADSVADQLEVYGFHSTPNVRAEGVVGVKEGRPKQDLTISFNSPAPVDYEFLGKELLLGAPEGTVRVMPESVRVNELSVGAFDGLIRTDLEAFMNGGGVTGEIDWTGLALPKISEAYEFENSPSGLVTGRFDFRLRGDSVGNLNGEGHVALEEAELFDVPMFGPLSPVIAAVLGNRKAGFQEAQSAFCSFEVEDGVFATEDFLTTTPSLVFTGDGKADLEDKEINMTIRMNARGLLGIITLPLRPFYGLFQFRGTGPIDNPEWKNVIFTSPPPAQNDNLLAPPKARAIPAREGVRGKPKPDSSPGRSRISPPNR